MWEKLQRYFEGRGFHPVDLHMENSRLYYFSSGTAVSMVWLLRADLIQGLSQEQYAYYSETIRSIFTKQGYEMVSILSLFLTSQVSAAKEIGEGSMFWIVDEQYGRLVVYENQPEDYLGLRGMIENNLQFGGNSRNSEGAQNKAQWETLRGGAAEATQAGTAGARQSTTENARREAAYKEYAKRQRKSMRKERLRGWRDTSWCVYALIIVNLIVFFFTDLLRFEDWLYAGGISWPEVLEGDWYRVFTSMFLHWDVGHVANNMLVLFGVGVMVEMRLGHVKFLLLYLLSGIGAGIASFLYHWRIGEYAISAGASGAIYGVAGAVVIMLLTEENSRNQGNFIRVGIFLLLLFSSVFTGGTTDNAAHIGGFLAGAGIFLIVSWLERRRWRKRYR